jgi:hypothetical protein
MGLILYFLTGMPQAGRREPKPGSIRQLVEPIEDSGKAAWGRQMHF